MFNYFQKKVHSVGWNSTGRKLASGSVDQTARILVFEGNTSIVKMEFV
jgi:WD40 repeat protein